MKTGRLLALVMVLTLLVSMPVISYGEQASDSTAGTVNAFGWEIPDETIEITAFLADGEYAPSEEQKIGRENMENYVLENFNVKLNMETTDGDGIEAINLMLASDTYPAVIYDADYDTVLKFRELGKAVEVTPYMDTICKDIKEVCGDTYPLLLDDEGKLWSIPIGVNEWMGMPDRAANLRYDEYLEIGSPTIETPDDYYAALKAILALHPTTPNGEKRYALSLNTDQNYIKDFLGFWGLKYGWKISDDNTFTYWTRTEEGKAMSKWFNQIYRDGLFDPDAFNNTFDDWKAKFSNEKIVGALGQWWTVYNAGHEVWQALDPTVSENKRYIQLGFKAPEADAAYLTGKIRTGGAYTIITDKATNVEGILKFIDFQATQPGRALFYWGIPNGVESNKDSGTLIKEWSIDENGNWSFDDAAKQAFISETWDYNQEALLGTNTYNFFSTFDMWEDGVSHVWPSYMWQDENKWKSMMINNLKDTIFDASPMTLMEKDEDTTLIEQAVRDAWTQYWPAVVQSQDDEAFEANWSKLQQAVEGANIDSYTQVMQDNYQKNIQKLGA